MTDPLAEQEHPHVLYFQEDWVPQWIKNYRWEPPTKDVIDVLRKYVLAKGSHIALRAEWDGAFDELPSVAEWDTEHSQQLPP